VAFAAWRTGGLWAGGRDALATTPVLYVPSVAGGFVLATAAGALGYATLGALAFGAGLFSWLALESVILHRLLVHEALAVPLLPTLGIQLAPPVVGCLAYLGLTAGPADRFALALFGYGLLQALVLVRLAGRIRAQRFAPSYWAITFGVTALANVSLHIVARGADEFEWLAGGLFAAANLVVAAIVLGTLVLGVRGRLLPASAGSNTG
jgi:tellurite resistance protein